MGAIRKLRSSVLRSKLRTGANVRGFREVEREARRESRASCGVDGNPESVPRKGRRNLSVNAPTFLQTIRGWLGFRR